MPAVTQQRDTLTGELTAFRAVGSDGWGFGTLLTEREAVSVVGKLVGVRAGESVELEGVWGEHPKYGRQLRVRKCTSVMPQTEDGTVAWLASTLPSVGPGRARALVERFGAQLWEIIHSDPMQLASVPGITPARVEEIRAAYLKHEADRDNMIRLRGWGLTDNQIARCLEEWKTLETVVERVRENPYQLADYVHGFGFERADKVATRAGVTHDSPARVLAGVRHVLGESRTDGHCYLRIGEVVRRSVALLGVERSAVGDALRAAISGRHMVRRGPRLYSCRIDGAENDCAHDLVRMMGGVA